MDKNSEPTRIDEDMQKLGFDLKPPPEEFIKDFEASLTENSYPEMQAMLMKDLDKEGIKELHADLGQDISIERADLLARSSKNLKGATELLLRKGVDLKESMCITEEKLEGLYAYAFSLFQAGKYREASKNFRSLFLLDRFNYRYAFALAVSAQKLADISLSAEDYINTSKLYFLSAALNTKDPMPYLHASECHFQAKDIGGAIIALQLGIDVCGYDEKYKKTKKQMKTLQRIYKDELSTLEPAIS